MPPETETFLIELARAAQRLGMYPPGHPVVAEVVASTREHLAAVLVSSPTFTIDVSRDHLTVGEIETSPDNTLFQALAQRLYRHLIYGLTFRQGIESDELQDFITALAVKPRDQSECLGAGADDQLARWPHITIEVIPFSSLTIAEGETEEGSVFTGLSDAAGIAAGSSKEAGVSAGTTEEAGVSAESSGEAGDSAESSEETGVAAESSGEAGVSAGSTGEAGVSAGGSDEGGVSAGGSDEAGISTGSAEADEALDQAREQLSDLNLEQLKDVLRGADPTDPAALREGVSQMIVGMTPQTMRDLVDNLPESYQQSAVEGSIEGAVREIMETADSGSSEGASGALLRLMTKLALFTEDTETPVSPGDDQQLVALLQRLGAGWNVENPNPTDYDEDLRKFNRTAEQLTADLKWSEERDAERILQISLEIDEAAPSTLKATADMISSGQTGDLMDLLENAPEQVEATENLWHRVDRKDTVVNVLEFQPVDYSTLDRVITRIWDDAAGPMLDRLLESDSRMERISLLERLERLGPDIGPAIMERLDDGPWYNLRNLLHLLGRLEVLPVDFSPWEFLEHDDYRVRREAFAIALGRDAFRSQALHQALNDGDSLVIEQALNSIQGRCPKDLIPYLIAMINDPDSLVKIKTACIRTLASSRDPEAFEVILGLVWQRKWVILSSLAPKSATMLAALAALANHWQQEPRAIKAVQSALRSSDPQIQTVARSTGSGS